MAELAPDAAAAAVERGEALYANLLSRLRGRLEIAGTASAGVALVGIHSGGAWVASRLHRDLALAAPLGFLSIAFHRDDYSQRGIPSVIQASQIDFDIDGRIVVLVDDILFTGRTVRAAINEIFDYGRPASIELAVLLDRGGRELPIQADFLGGRHEMPASGRFVLTRTDDGRFSLAIGASTPGVA